MYRYSLCLYVYTRMWHDMTYNPLVILFIPFSHHPHSAVQIKSRMENIWWDHMQFSCDCSVDCRISSINPHDNRSAYDNFRFLFEKYHFLTLTLSQNRRFSQSSARFPLWTVFNVYMLQFDIRRRLTFIAHTQSMCKEYSKIAKHLF